MIWTIYWGMMNDVESEGQPEKPTTKGNRRIYHRRGDDVINIIMDKMAEAIGRPIVETIQRAHGTITNILKMGDVKMAKYIMIDDKNLQMNGTIFPVAEEDEKHYIVDINGTKAWVKKNQAKVMENVGAPGIPEAFDAGDSMHVPEKVEIPRYEGRLERTTPELSPEEVNKMWFPESNIKSSFRLGKGKSVAKDVESMGAGSGFLEEWPNVGWPKLDNVDWKDNAITAEKIQANAVYSYQGEITTWEKDPRTIAMSDDNDRLRAVEKALRNRSKKKGASNERLSKEKDMLEKTLVELRKDLNSTINDRNEWKHRHDQLIETINEAEKTILHIEKRLKTVKAERDEYKSLNDHHRNELEIGNERREKIKKSMEHLHEENRGLAERNVELIRMIEAKDAEIDRAKRVIDALTIKPSF
jgi:hypothetical protein